MGSMEKKYKRLMQILQEMGEVTVAFRVELTAPFY